MASINRDEISRLELLHAAHPEGLVFPHLADAYRRAGRYSQAEGVLTAGLRNHSDYSTAHVVLGRLRLDQGKEGEAEEAFRRVLELDPDNHVAMEYLATLALEQGRMDEALRQMRRLARVKPTQEIQQRLRELEARAARTAPVGREPAPTRRAGGAETGGVTPARSAATNGAGLPEPGEVVTETMAELYARQGLYERAARVYRQLLERAPDDRRLMAKLRAAESQVRPSPRSGGDEGGATRGERPNQAASSAGAPPAAPRPPAARPRERPPTPTPEPAPGPEPWAAGAPREAGGTIRGQLGTLLAWKPEPPRAPVRSPGRAPGVADEPSDAGDRAPAPHELEVDVARRLAGGELGTMEGLEAAEPRARSLIAIADLLVGLLEYRDPFFRGSSSLTRLVATSVGEELGLSPTEQVDLALAAILRDLGRVAMGGRLVAKSSPETPEVRRKIERHVELALQLLEGIELPDRVRSAVRHHHERWDGTGYPDRLAGESIPRLGRILAVVDSFAAMVSPRSYRLPRKVPEAARELREAAGSQYDPEVVQALMRVLARGDHPHLGFVQRPHVLLVDPDQPGALVTAAKLCGAGYLAEVAPTAATALERLRRVPVSALVVSAELGEAETAALIRQLRVNDLFAALPVVVEDAEDVFLRVRLLDSGADVCFPPGTTYAELQGTLGALVRRTIQIQKKTSETRKGAEARQPGEAPWLALQGDIEDFPLTWLLQVMKYDSRTAAIRIRTSTDDGAIFLDKGDAIHAEIRGGPMGEGALRQMLQWRSGRFTVQPDGEPREATIETSIMHLLLTQAVTEDHAAAGIFGTVSAEH
jgi:HD-GYP domain-containing protein (c-di-GMP phosphodiesterase class II)/tetratricopeptide (TPR) repeat protein/CheY-like chemotaxis protein